MQNVVTAGDLRARLLRWSRAGRYVQQMGTHKWVAHMSSGCEAPAVIEWTGRKETVDVGAHGPAEARWRREPWQIRPWVRYKAEPLVVDQWVQCRACSWCLNQRSRLWRLRASYELAESQRSWLLTLTINPIWHAVLLERAKAAEYSAFLLHEECSKEITKYLKRVRKESGAVMRYLCVAEEGERHQRLHYHLLVHEVHGTKPIRYRTLKTQWRCGFIHAKQVRSSAEAAQYVTKVAGYLSKSALARVRASKRYGGVREANDS